ncbi:hypothetical protein N7G274_006304 [Stereocaulon virgatum]|uniref:Uncharacterized protein n=1 Tax=Stereocaulon virgatum TaxID=373712 RepID=A0ABR4A7F8_9LECA
MPTSRPPLLEVLGYVERRCKDLTLSTLPDPETLAPGSIVLQQSEAACHIPSGQARSHHIARFETYHVQDLNRQVEFLTSSAAYSSPGDQSTKCAVHWADHAVL